MTTRFNIDEDIIIKIETYWNVNTRHIRDISTVVEIKIETYWNVNEYKEE